MNKVIFFSLGMLLVGFNAYAGTITGTVTLNGTAPENEVLSMDADPSCAGSNGDTIYDEKFLVGESGGLQNVFVYIKEGLEGQSFEAPAESVSIDQKDCRYTPRVLGLQVGQKLEIMNSDPTLHNVHGMPKNSKEFNLGMPIQGMKLKRTFDEPEVMVAFKCDVHPWMRSYIGVLPHPFYSVSGKDGNFQINDLPAGTYTVEAWHENFGVSTQSIVVDDESDQTLNFLFEG